MYANASFLKWILLMFAPGEIVYGYVKHIGKPKYAVSMYRDEDVNILIHFTTSQSRAGVPLEQVHHGAMYKDGDCKSYVFEARREIGTTPASSERFSFPLRTTMVFDYGLLKDSEEKLRQMFENPQVVCKLDEAEYIDLVYAMYSSKSTPDEYKPYLNKVLTEHFSEK